MNLNGAWRVRKLVAVEPSSGCHTRAPESNRAESLLEAPLRRAVLEAVQVDRTESFFSSGAEWPEGGCIALYDVWRVWLYGCSMAV